MDMVVPALSSVTPLQRLYVVGAELAQLNEDPLAIVSVPNPEIVPPSQTIGPLTVNQPAVLSVAPLIVRPPAMAEVVLMRANRPRGPRADWLRRDRQAVHRVGHGRRMRDGDAGRSMTASSDAVGMCWSIGLAELTQLLASIPVATRWCWSKSSSPARSDLRAGSAPAGSRFGDACAGACGR